MINIKENLEKAYSKVFNLLKNSADNELIAGGLVVLYAITAILQSLNPENNNDDTPDNSAANAQMWATLGSAVVSFGGLLINKCSNKSWGKYFAGRLFNFLVQGASCVGAIFTAQGMTNGAAAGATYVGAAVNMLTTLGALISLCDTRKIKENILPVVRVGVTAPMSPAEFSLAVVQLPSADQVLFNQRMRTHEYYGTDLGGNDIYLHRANNTTRLLTPLQHAQQTPVRLDNGAGTGLTSAGEDRFVAPTSPSLRSA